MDIAESNIQIQSVNRAFSKQSEYFDLEDRSNPVLQDMRQQVYAHVERYLPQQSNILELNAGTGIDALYFASRGHHIHATDVADGMIAQLRIKAETSEKRITFQQLSYDQLHRLSGSKFNYVFSNFGGLNCIEELSRVTLDLKKLLTPGAFVTWTIMPTVCLWEIAGIVKGNFRGALRRFSKRGADSHLEGEYFKTYYHNLSSIRRAFDNEFRFIEAEGLGAISPQPHHAMFASRHPKIYKALRAVDERVNRYFPFNRWADHIIVTFQYIG